MINLFTSPFNLILLNTTKFSNLLHGQTSLKDTIFSVLNSAVKLLLISLSNAHMDIYLLSGTNFPIHFSLSLKDAMHRMGNALNILRPKCKEQEESYTHFIFYCKLSKTTLKFMSELINLNYSFNIPFKISLKNPLGAFFSIP